MSETNPALRAGAVVRFAGDSGDGIQLTGKRFSARVAGSGHALTTAPEFPAEIRAPAGSLAGVSAFQVQFAESPVLTAGDCADVLVAMNPAALATNLEYLRRGGVLILNSATFTARNLAHARLARDPREDSTLQDYRVVEVDLDQLTLAAVQAQRLRRREVLRCRNYAALGLVCWLYEQPLDDIPCATPRTPAAFARANRAALLAGYNLGDTLELARAAPPASHLTEAGAESRIITGNEALALGLMAAAERAGLELFYSGYPITPASDILHYLAGKQAYGVRTLQAEDEMAAACAAIGAAFGGALAATGTSGPGMDLKSEALGLAVSLELPLVVVDVQRAGPSTGIPTRPEQADLELALYGRHGEAPVPVLAARSPADCFDVAYAAARLALQHMTPVVMLSDAAIANGAERWQVPALEQLPDPGVAFATDPGEFQPYARDERGVRPWAIPGTPGLEHRLGGLEKRELTGEVCYEPDNHERMVEMRADKIARLRAFDPADGLERFGAERGKLLVVSWGSTFGAVRTAVEQLHARNPAVAHVHVRQLNPLPEALAAEARHFKRVLVPELNRGQLARLLRAEFLIDARALTKLQGRPLSVSELLGALSAELEQLRDCA